MSDQNSNNSQFKDDQLSYLANLVFELESKSLKKDLLIKKLRKKNINFRTSTSWKITLPIRKIKLIINNITNNITSFVNDVSKLIKILKIKKNNYFEYKSIFKRAFKLKFENISSPKVSIIIPVYGQIQYTLKCLESIGNFLPECSIEIIIINDCSPDNTLEVLNLVDGIKIISNEINLGFIKSCNKGANLAAGEYIYFLNNDTQVTKNWLDELLLTFNNFPGTGLVGSKLVYPDGRLQEAGGLVWGDGGAMNFGRFQDPQAPVYNYAREVDYCSGASIMLPKKVFIEAGGFDELYLPAYCEDTDLAINLRNRGYRVIYQPFSTVIHYEGISSGTDDSKGVKSYQVENLKKFFSKWQTRLNQYQTQVQGVENAKDRRAAKRVLFIDHGVPTPDQDSGSIDAFNHMLLLREMDFQVTIHAEINLDYIPELQRVGVEVLYKPYDPDLISHMKKFGKRYDLVFICRPDVAKRYIYPARKYCQNAKILFHTVDLHFLRMQRAADINNDNTYKILAEQMKMQELLLINYADVTTVLSDYELQILLQNVEKNKLKLLPYSRRIEGKINSFNDRKDIVFVGGYKHPPNIDAVLFFVNNVMPLLRIKIPTFKFYIVGSNPPEEITNLACEDIIVIGFIKDLNPFLENIRLSVAPLRYGAGIKGKIGTSLSVGLPVIATNLAIEGMALTDGENVLVADTPEEIANTIYKVYNDEQLWNKISDSGINFAVHAWGAEVALKKLRDVIENLDIKINDSKYPIKLY